LATTAADEPNKELQMTDHPRLISEIKPVEPLTKPNDAAWLEVYIARAAEPIDFGPVKRRIRDRKLAATEAETLNSIQLGTNLAARTARFIPLPPARDPWEDTKNDD
jgi:hypothetical protein